MAGRVVVVVGACGGVGASTLAALLALRASTTGSAALVDVDAHGPGVEVLLGTEGAPGVRWPDLAGLRGSLAADDLDGVLPSWRGVEVLGGDRRGGGPPDDAVAALWPALLDRCATVVVDAPVHALAAPPVRRVLASAAHVALVTGQDVRGVAAGLVARAALDAGTPDAPSAGLVLRRRRAPRVAPLEAAHVLDLALLALVPGDRRVAEATDRGFGPLVGRRSALARAVAGTARACGVLGRAGRG